MPEIMQNDKFSSENNLKEGMSSENVKKVGDAVYKTVNKRKRSISTTVKEKFQGCASVKNDQNYGKKLSHMEELLSDKSIQFVLQNRKKVPETVSGSSLRKKLTRNNIRTILRHVLSNKYIFTMLQRILKGEYNNPSELKIETGFEPRPTQLKARKMRARQCEEFPSDEEAEISVKTREFGSPRCRKSFFSFPISKAAGPISEDEDALVIAISENEENLEDSNEADTVAQRTRSKQPLTDTTLAPIVIAPDITVDMYCTGNSTYLNHDPYQDFLLNYPIEPTVVPVNDEEEPEPDDREDDPDYIFPEEDTVDFSFLDIPQLKEIAEEDVDDPKSIPIEEEKMEEDYFCLNDSIEIQSDELNDKMTEILKFAQQDLKDVTDNESKTNNSVPFFYISGVLHVKNVETKLFWINSEKRRQLDEQMRMYVQLLTQTYLLSHGKSRLNFINVSSKVFLEEIKMFSDREIAIDELSAFYSHNLDGSLAIVKEFEAMAVPLLESSSMKKKSYTAPDVPQHIRGTLASSQVFIYPELLPKVGFFDIFRKAKATTFPPFEDNLIALGMEQFAGLKNSVECIQQHLVPTKTVLQIKNHIKRSRRLHRAAENNPIKYFSVHKRVPQLVRVIRMFDPDNIKSPEDFPPSVLPKWMAPYSKVEDTTSPVLSQNPRVVPKLQKPKKFVPILPKHLQFIVPMPHSINKKTLLPHSDIRKPPQHPLKSKGASNITEDASELDSDYERSLNEVPSELDSDSGSSLSVDNLEEDSESILRPSERLVDKVPRHIVMKEESSNGETTSTLESLTWEKSLSSLSVDEDTEDHISHAEEASNCSEPNVEFLNMNIQVIEDSVSELQPTLIETLSKNTSETTDTCEISTPTNNEYIMSKNVPWDVIENAVYIPVVENLQHKKNAPSTFTCIRDMIQSPKGKHNQGSPAKEFKLADAKWNRNEDELIISNCQKFGINLSAFTISAKSIGSRTVDEVQERFLDLLKTLSAKLKYVKD